MKAQPNTADMVPVTLAGEPVQLLADRALFWPRERTLFIADPHFGKAASFRIQGIAAPDGTVADLERLSRLILRTGAQRVVVLGDFFHARAGVNETTLHILTGWRSNHRQIEMVLVRGNHDRHAGDPPERLGINSVPEPWIQSPWACCHEPCLHAGHHVLAGHIHPGIALRDRNGARLRSACFWLRPHCTVLPAFGEFTGLDIITREPDHRVIAVNGPCAIEV